MIFEQSDYKLTKIQRYGFFKNNKLLSDDTIVSEILGKDGQTKQMLKKMVDVSNRAQMSAIREQVKRVLENNVVWKNHILRILNDIEIEFSASKIEISLFNPSTGIFTPYFVLTQNQGSLYIPSFYIIVHNPDSVRMYFGGLMENGRAMAFDDLLKKYYMGDLNVLFFNMSK